MILFELLFVKVVISVSRCIFFCLWISSYSSTTSWRNYFCFIVLSLLLVLFFVFCFVLFYFLSLFSQCFLILEDFPPMSSRSEILNCFQSPNEFIKGIFFNSFTVFLTSSISFLFFLEIYVSLLTSSLCSCMLSPFFH